MSQDFLSIGLMSGTSMDAIDAVLLRVGPKGDKVLEHASLRYPPALRERLFQLLRSPQASLEEFGALNFDVGLAFARAAEKCLAQARRGRKFRGEVDVIGSHGQTVFHNPARFTSIQIASPQAIAEKTGITVVSNFRMADIAAGGEGAPLLPFYHRRILGKIRSGFAVHNLGGISNFTYFGPKDRIVALDTGPANCWMDVAIESLSGGKLSYDHGGRWAKKGKSSKMFIQWLGRIPEVARYRALPAPKSTGRELFSPTLLDDALAEAKRMGLTKEEILSSLLDFSVELACEAYERFVIQKGFPLEVILFTGGGALNPVFLARFQNAFPQVKISTMESLGKSSQTLEAEAFALFALQALAGIPQNLPLATGASRAVVGGEIAPGKNWDDLYRKVHRASARSVSYLR